MRTLLRTSTFCFGAVVFSLAQAEAHIQAHEVRRSGGFVPVGNVVESVEVGYGGGKGYADQGDYKNGGENKGEGRGNMEGKNNYGGNSKHAEGGWKKTTIRETRTIIETPAAKVEGMGKDHVVVQVAVETSFITKTVVESGVAITITYTPEPQVMTQMITVTAATTVTEAGPTVTAAGPTITAPGTTVTAPGTTITEAGTCAPTGLTTAEVVAAHSSETSTITPPAETIVTSAVYEPPQAATSSIATSLSYIAPGPVNSDKVAQGTGTRNAAGHCDCACLCGIDSFPSITYASAANPPAVSPTTLQTVASAAPESMLSVSVAGSEASSTISPVNTISSSTDVESGSSMGVVSPSTSSATDITTTSASISSISETSSASATSSPPESSPESTSETLVSAQPATTNSISLVAAASQSTVPAQGPDVPFDISSLSLSSMLVLGNLAAQATPTP